MTVANGRRCERRERVSAPRDDARESDRAARTRWRPGSCSTASASPASSISRDGRTQTVNIAARGDPVRRADQFAAAAEAVGRSGRPRSCRRSGIPVVHDLPGVGENLQDHLEFYFQVACTEPVTPVSLGEAAREGADRRALAAVQGRARRDAIISRPAASSAAAPGIPYPDIQYHFLPMAVAYDGSTLAREHGFQAHVGPMRSKSRGWVRLASTDPSRQAAHPLQLHEPSGRLGRDARLRAADARDLRATGLRPLSRPRDPARRGRAERRADRRLHPREGGKRVSPVLHLQDGRRGRSDGGRRSARPA